MKTILIVEDNQAILGALIRALSSRLSVIPALTIAEAERCAGDNCYDFIAVDGCVPGDELNTEPLVRWLKQHHGGPTIAISSDKEKNEKLVAAGCTHACHKTDLPRFLRSEFGV